MGRNASTSREGMNLESAGFSVDTIPKGQIIGHSGGVVMAKHELTFKKEKETKNTIRYQEEPVENQPPIIGALYIQKWVRPADSIKVTLEW